MKTGSILKKIIVAGAVSILIYCGYISSQNCQYEKDLQSMKAKMAMAPPLASSVKHKQLVKDGYSIHYFVSGNPENEAIVFLHPAFGDHRCFDQQIDYFSKNYYVITVDMLGHGLSQAINSEDKINASTEHIKEIMEQESLDASHIVGVSLGSIIAQQFSLQFPEYTLSLTGIGSFDTKKENKEVMRAQIVEGLKWLPKILFSMKSFRRYAASVTVIDPIQQARFYESMSGFKRRSFRFMSGIEYFTKEHKNTSRSFPLLILYGDHDLELAQKASHNWHKQEPNSHLHEIKNAGHCANMDNANEFNTVLNNFLASIPKNNPSPLTAEK